VTALNGIYLRAATSKEIRAPLRDAREDGGFGLRVGLWETREGRSRRRRCAAVRFDAASEPRGLLVEVECGAPPATAVIVPGLLAQSTRFWVKSNAEPHRRLSPSCQASSRRAHIWSRKPCARQARRRASGSCLSHLSPIPVFPRPARFMAAYIAERSAPLPRWKRLAGGLSRLTFPYTCARSGVYMALYPCA
jgi:hypothetical protein